MKEYGTSRSKTSATKEIVLAVGGRAFVSLPASGSGTGQSAPMNDDCGRVIANDLRDGQEVEILAWRPRARAGVAYQIRRLSDGSEWWIQALYLRRTALLQTS